MWPLRRSLGARRGRDFTLDSVPSYVLCTDDVKTYLEERRCTNLAFLEAGEVVSE